MTQQIELRPATEADTDFWFETKKLTLGRYIAQTFGWDETAQLQIHADHFVPAECQIIWIDGTRAGGLQVTIHADHVHLAELMLHPAFQRRGLGTQLIHSVLAIAANLHLPTRLLVLRVNPALKLYERLGFVVTEEAPTHVTMQYQV